MDGESGFLAANALPRDIPFVAPESLIPFPSTALNAITLSLAKDLAKDGVKVNAADPGYTKTDFNNHTGYRTVEQAANTIVWLAGQDASGPPGGFFFERSEAPW